MIRWRVLSRTGRMRTSTKLQIFFAIVIGFLVGYVFIPNAFSPTPTDQQQAARLKGQRNEGWLARLGHTFESDLTRVRERGIEFSGENFLVRGRKMKILSGAIHYFRVVPDYWEDRLLRLKAAGLNTVETYIAWNLHEPVPGQFDFTGILDVGEYIQTAHRLGLNVIVRPGPYICAEWEFGGLPAWLLHDPNMRVRTTYPLYLGAVQRYFGKLIEVLEPLQAAYGGPIIAFQIENEFSHYAFDPGYSDTDGSAYMKSLHKVLRDLGVVELLFTSDGQMYLEDVPSLRPAFDVLLTVNFQKDNNTLERLREVQPGKPLMVMEFWTGWFDHWGDPHLARNIALNDFSATVRKIISLGSINFYMFHGGTNFGFMNGANWADHEALEYAPTITSYDYGAPISECGDITEKYLEVRAITSQLAPESLPVHPLPPIPKDHPKQAYGEVRLTLYISLFSTIHYIPEPYLSANPIAMEYLPVNENSGQGYGYVLYRTQVSEDAHSVTVHGLRDYGVAMMNFKPVQTLSYFGKHNFLLPKSTTKGTGRAVLDILVENAGRVNYGFPLEVRRGITGKVEVDGEEKRDWKIFSFEFKSSFVENIDAGGMWVRTPAPSTVGPALFKGSFTIEEEPKDTFADMTGWGKGILFINGANLGRFWSRGPQQTLYVPAPLLRRGVNKVMIFEMHQPPFKNPQTISFRSAPLLDSNRK